VYKEPEKQSGDEPSGPRRPYKSPRIEILGDVRDVTLGGSPGPGDSNGIGTNLNP
jgi:hypothetical protein